MDIHENFMKIALDQAVNAYEDDEVPVGCVIVHKGRIIAKAYNMVKKLKDPTAHAEILAITSAADYLKNERLIDTDLYVTIEPCIMCAGAIVLARVKRVIFGADDTKAGAFGSVFNILENKKLNHTTEVIKGVLEKESSDIMKMFFRQKREISKQ